MNKFVLFSLDETIRSDDGPQFWSNDDGWGDLSNATTFTFEEVQKFDRPLGTVWAELPPVDDDTIAAIISCGMTAAGG